MNEREQRFTFIRILPPVPGQRQVPMNEMGICTAEDGAFEMPYLGSLGLPWRYEGREKVEGFFKFVRDLYPDMDFRDVKVVCETPVVVVGEYEFTTKSSKTGRVIHQLFVGRLEAENGRSNCFANRSIWSSWDWPSIRMVWLATSRLQSARSKSDREALRCLAT